MCNHFRQSLQETTSKICQNHSLVQTVKKTHLSNNSSLFKLVSLPKAQLGLRCANLSGNQFKKLHQKFAKALPLYRLFKLNLKHIQRWHIMLHYESVMDKCHNWITSICPPQPSTMTMITESQIAVTGELAVLAKVLLPHNNIACIWRDHVPPLFLLFCWPFIRSKGSLHIQLLCPQSKSIEKKRSNQSCSSLFTTETEAVTLVLKLILHHQLQSSRIIIRIEAKQQLLELLHHENRVGGAMLKLILHN